jgi:hypothetical protein
VVILYVPKHDRSDVHHYKIDGSGGRILIALLEAMPLAEMLHRASLALRL